MMFSQMEGKIYDVYYKKKNNVIRVKDVHALKIEGDMEDYCVSATGHIVDMRCMMHVQYKRT